MHDCRKLLAVVLLSLAFPTTALAQAPPYGAAPSDSTDFEQARQDASVAALNALSETHRSQVHGIVDRFDAGSLSFDDAARQIDTILSPDENKALLAQEQQFRSKLRPSQAGDERGGPPPVDSPAGPPPEGFPGGGPPAGGFPADAGSFLLRIAASPQALAPGEGPP